MALETRGEEGLVLCIVDNDLPPKAHGSDRFLRGVPRGRPHTHKHTHTHTHWKRSVPEGCAQGRATHTHTHTHTHKHKYKFMKSGQLF